MPSRVAVTKTLGAEGRKLLRNATWVAGDPGGGQRQLPGEVLKEGGTR